MAQFYRRRFGGITVTALSDGVIEVTPEIAGSSLAGELRAFLRTRSLPEVQIVSVNAFALQFDDHTILIDTGAGDKLGPTLGRLGDSLAAAEIEPHKIESVLLTHIHPDHSNGLIDANGIAVYPSAELVVHQEELSHWLDDAKMAQVGSRERRNNFEAGRRAIAPYRDRIRPFRNGEVLPGVQAMPLAGHTPGHTGYLIGSGDEKLLVWGDIVHLHDVQPERPDITVALDTDRRAARATRERIMMLAAIEQFAVAGMHLHFPGLARVARGGAAFALLPV